MLVRRCAWEAVSEENPCSKSKAGAGNLVEAYSDLPKNDWVDAL